MLSAQANLDNIVFLKQQIGRLEAAIQNQVKLSEAFNCLLTAPGIGKILAMTIVFGSRRYPSFCNCRQFCLLLPLRIHLPSGYPMAKAKAVATVKTAIDI